MFSGLCLLEYFLIYLVIVYALFAIGVFVFGPQVFSLVGIPLGADFVSVYAAGMQVDDGAASMVYDWKVHHEVEQSLGGDPFPYLLWLYPPPFLAVASFLAVLPYRWAFAVYMGIGFVLYLKITSCLAPPKRLSVWALAAYPGVFYNFMCGQNGFITAALLGAGALCLEKRPWIAGIMFGLLCYKPQFFVLIPIALAVGCYGRALISTLTTALLCVGLSWFFYGPLAWHGFFYAAAETLPAIFGVDNAQNWYKFLSIFGWARAWGAGLGACYVLQILTSLLSVLMMVWVWTSPTSLETRVATLCGAILLTTPYFLGYDLVILAVPLALLMRQGLATGFVHYEKILLGALWLLPLLATQCSRIKIPLALLLIIGMMVLCFLRSKISLSRPGNIQ